ncbi:MAG: MCE family protein [Kiritimatiellaeota bacterium]|nr:MCE family protein [Kiritimatiellota bacterium]
MANEIDRFKLGLFLVGAGLVLIGALGVLGSGRIFARPLHLVSFFDESVQGLETGSAVKWRGVRVGRVSRILLDANARLVRVEMDVNTRRFAMEAAAESGRVDLKKTELKKIIRQKIRQGLRSRLELTGITGMKYVEFDFFPTRTKRSPCPTPPVAEAICIPSVPSSLAQLQESVTRTAERVAAIDFEGISKDIEALLQNANNVLGNPALVETLQDLKTAGRAFSRLSTRLDGAMDEQVLLKVKQDLSTVSGNLATVTTRLNRLLENKTLEETLNDFRTAGSTARSAAVRLDKQLANLDLPGIARDTRRTLGEARRAAKAITGTRTDLRQSLHELDLTLTALRRLIEQVQNDPSILVRGNPTEEE